MTDQNADFEAEYPALTKMNEVREQSQLIGEFVQDFLPSKGIELVERDENGRYFSSYYPIEKLLAEFFDVDLDAVEAERRKMLESLQ